MLCCSLVVLFVVSLFSPPNTFALNASSHCGSLDVEGLSSPAGLLHVLPNWWAWVSVNSDGTAHVQATPCPAKRCTGALLQQGDVADLATSAFHQCAFPRDDSPNNLLCGSCVDGYAEWNNQCVDCRDTDGRLLFVSFLLLFFIVLFLHAATGPSKLRSGLLTILLYFGQTSLLEVDTVSSLVGWLKFMNYDAQSTGVCLAQRDNYEQTVATLAVPLVILIQLAFIGLAHRYSGGMAIVCCECACSKPLVRWLHSWHASFNVGHYAAVVLQIMLFCYIRTAVTCLQVGNNVMHFICTESW
jgi:hypothetical protein